MVMIEMRQAAQDTAFELVDELKDLNHQKKMVLCELEDTLYDCFEEAKEEESEEKSDEGTDLGFKSKYNRHYAMRNFDGKDDDYDMMHSYRRHRAMRRNRMGRYA